MATTPPPAYGYGQQTPASIDAVNIWMRGQPWYAQMMQSWGKDPAHPGGLSDAQRTAVVRGAQANGVIVDESHQEVDPNGNFRTIGHGLRNTMIVAGLAAATIATMGAAGAFAGAAGVGAGASGAAGAGAGIEGAATTGLASAAGIGGATAIPGAATAGLLASVPSAAGAFSALPAAAASPGIGAVGTGAAGGIFGADGLVTPTGSSVTDAMGTTPFDASSAANASGGGWQSFLKNAVTPGQGQSTSDLLGAGKILAGLGQNSANNSATAANNQLASQVSNRQALDDAQKKMQVDSFLASGGVNPNWVVKGLPVHNTPMVDPASQLLYGQLAKQYGQNMPALTASATTPISPTAGNPSTGSQVLSDVGAGTGIFSQLWNAYQKSQGN